LQFSKEKKYNSSGHSLKITTICINLPILGIFGIFQVAVGSGSQERSLKDELQRQLAWDLDAAKPPKIG
jgi:hypothetical protein